MKLLFATSLAVAALLATQRLSRPGIKLGGVWWALAMPVALLWLAGALATLVYVLHCPESAAPFLAVWYVLGIALPTLLGAASERCKSWLL